MRLLTVALLATVLSGAVARADSQPRLDCRADAAESTQHAKVEVWFGVDLRDWAPPPCTEWSARPFTVLIEATGETALTGGPYAILARLARISDLTTIRYWSTTRDRWRDLITESTALIGPDPAHRRTDFDEAELIDGICDHLGRSKDADDNLRISHVDGRTRMNRERKYEMYHAKNSSAAVKNQRATQLLRSDVFGPAIIVQQTTEHGRRTPRLCSYTLAEYDTVFTRKKKASAPASGDAGPVALTNEEFKKMKVEMRSWSLKQVDHSFGCY